jgi:hypothetical protein
VPKIFVRSEVNTPGKGINDGRGDADICRAPNAYMAGLQSRYVFLHFVQALRLEDVSQIIARAILEFRIAKRPQYITSSGYLRT